MPSQLLRTTLAAAAVGCALLTGCATPCPATAPQPESAPASESVAAIETMIDAWHAAAARADEDAYFALLSDDSVFLGTDKTERWNKQAFREFAHPHFVKGKAWSFRAVRRDVVMSSDGTMAWFDEDLDTPNLGPARGSGVVVLHEGRWLIAHYNLAVTVPNERFDDFKKALGIGSPTVTESDPPEATEPAP